MEKKKKKKKEQLAIYRKKLQILQKSNSHARVRMNFPKIMKYIRVISCHCVFKALPFMHHFSRNSLVLIHGPLLLNSRYVRARKPRSC